MSRCMDCRGEDVHPVYGTAIATCEHPDDADVLEHEISVLVQFRTPVCRIASTRKLPVNSGAYSKEIS